MCRVQCSLICDVIAKILDVINKDRERDGEPFLVSVWGDVRFGVFLFNELLCASSLVWLFQEGWHAV